MPEYYKIKDQLIQNTNVKLEPKIDYNDKYNVPTVVFHNFEDKSFIYTGKMKANDILNFIEYKYPDVHYSK